MLLVLALTLALEAADGGELGHLLPVEGVAVEAGSELGLVLVLLVQLLVPLQLLARLVPGARPLDLEAVESVGKNICKDTQKIFVPVYVGGDGLDVVPVHQRPLMEPPEEPDLELAVAVLLAHHLGGPVREALLLGIHDLVEGPTRFCEPVLVAAGVGVPRVQS